MIQKYKKFIERVDDESWEQQEQDWSDDHHPWNADVDETRSDKDYYDDEYYGGDTTIDDGMEHILYLLRNTLRNKGIEEFFVENRKFDICISVVMLTKERLSNVRGIFDILYHLKTDIIPQYDSEFDMYQTRKGETILEFNFYLNEGLEDNYDDEEQSNDEPF
jgi:hypothetical protein